MIEMETSVTKERAARAVVQMEATAADKPATQEGKRTDGRGERGDHAGTACSKDDVTATIPSEDDVTADIWKVAEDVQCDHFRGNCFLECLEGVSQACAITNTVLNALQLHGLAVLTSGPGQGKTTAALLALRASVAANRALAYFHTPEDVDWKSRLRRSESALVVIDNFLGHSSLDGFHRWKKVWQDIADQHLSCGPKVVQFLLVTRTDVLNRALRTWTMDLVPLLGCHNTVKLQVDARQLLKDCYPELSEIPDIAEVPCPMGFPLACRLHKAVRAVSDCSAAQFFRDPQPYIVQAVGASMQRDAHLKLGWALLALADGAVPRAAFLGGQAVNSTGLDSRTILERLGGRALSQEDLATVLQRLEAQCETWVCSRCHLFSFASDVVRLAVLTVLCHSHTSVLAQVLGAPALAQTLTLEPGHDSGTSQRLAVTGAALDVFVHRLVEETERKNFRDVFSTQLLKDEDFRRRFYEQLMNTASLDTLVHAEDKDGLHFLFWVAASPEILIELGNSFDFFPWELCQALAGCCVWGFPDLAMDVYDSLKEEARRLVASATLGDIVWDRFRGLSLDWGSFSQGVPFHPEDTLLTVSAWRGHSGLVKELLQADTPLPLDQSGKARRTALMHFCIRGNEAMLEFLLGRKADTASADVLGNTALHFACMTSCSPVSPRLADSRFVHLQNKRGVSPLMIACERETFRSHLLWYEVLLKKNAKPNAADIEGRSPLHFACSNGNNTMISVIAKKTKTIDSGATPSPLMYLIKKSNCAKAIRELFKLQSNCMVTEHNLVEACKTSDLETIDTVLALYRSRDDAVEIPSDRLLLASCSQGSPRVLKKLLKKLKVDIEKSRVLYFHEAAKLGSKILVDFFTSKQLDINVRSNEGTTPLMFALEKGYCQLADYLVRKGNKPHDVDKAGNSSLHYAVRSNSSKLLERLLTRCKIGVDVENCVGETPLHVACQCGSLRTAKCLLSRRADPNKRDKDGENCLHKAVDAQCLPLVRLFKMLAGVGDKKGATPLMHACEAGSEEVVGCLATESRTLEIRDNTGDMAIHYAVNGRNVKVVELCLRHNPRSLKAKGHKGLTPLHIATLNGDEEMARWLLSQGADPNARDEEAYSSIHLARAIRNDKLENLFASATLG